MKITMCKSQGRTLKEVHVEFNKDEYTTRGLGFVADPFFTEHIKTLENLQKKQCASGLEFNMEKMKKIVGWTWPDAPEGVRKAIIDADQLWESFGPSRSSGKSCIDAMLHHPTDAYLAAEDAAIIRLTRNQARQMADHLNALADHLFFEEQRTNANE